MIIDTNIFSDIRAGEPTVSELLDSHNTIHVPVVVVAELKQGFLGGNKTAENNNMLEMFLASANVEILEINIATSQPYSEISSILKKSGKALAHNDIWIAALAVQYGYPLLTRDKDFRPILQLLPKGSTIL